MKILVLNGPNINMTGKREAIYGSQTMSEINEAIGAKAAAMAIKVEFFQANGEGEIIDKIQTTDADGIILNAGAYTHYSYAIADALKCTAAATVEVHMTNVAARESFRHVSVIAPACVGVIAGFGKQSYLLALDALHARLG